VLEKADAFIAAWLPGTEGAGITDVLFGDYKPTGKLSFRWPSLFAYGFGLSY
jgi:beta-glucosidase